MRIAWKAGVALAVLGVAAGTLVATPAQAAPAQAWIAVEDPLSTDPVQLEVAAMDSDGWAAPFTGTVTLKVGKTSTTTAVSSPDGQTSVRIPTTTLASGPLTATATLKVGGRTLKASVSGVIDIPPTIVLRGFGCGVVTPKQQRVAWQVRKLNGTPMTYPSWTQAADTFPAYIHTVKPTTIADSLGQPLSTKGSVVIRTAAGAKVATFPLKPAVRRMLFSVPWRGTVNGRFTPGDYTATATLIDAHGRTATATQDVLVARSSVGICL